MRRAALAISLALAATPALADREVSRTVNITAPRGNVKRVIVDIPAGEIRVRNSDGNTLAVNGVISREYDGTRGRVNAQNVIDDVSVEVIVDGDEATIRRRLGKNARGWRGENFIEYDLRVDVPKGVDLEVGTRFGEVSIEGTFNNVEADLRAGELEFRAPRSAVGELSASCRVGEVRADFGDKLIDREGVFPGRTYFVNANGKGRVKLHVTAGEVKVKLTGQ